MERDGLTPEFIATRQFKLCRRGYDPDDVSEFLAEVAAVYQRALDQAAADRARAHDAQTESAPPTFEELGAEAGALMQAAKEGADSLRRRAEEEAEAIMKGAIDEAEARMREVTLETERLRNAVKRQCEEMLADVQARTEHLAAHERDMRKKVGELEELFVAFRSKMEASIPEATDGSAAERTVTHEPAQPATRS